MNFRFLFVAGVSLLLFTQVHGAPKSTASATSTNTAATPAEPKTPPKAQPVHIAAPAFVDAVTFNVEDAGEKRIITVTSAPGLIRIDTPNDRLSVIYDPATQHYTGLEHSNYTWWEFSWPEVRNAVENTPRYAARLRDMGPELLEENALQPTSTNSDSGASTSDGTTTNTVPANSEIAATTDPNAPTDSAGSDDTGYVWHPTTEKKKIGEYECEHWVGETVAGEKIDAWCTTQPLPQVETALKILQTVNEPMALVPVRNLMPPLAFVAWKALAKGGSTPILMTWGSDQDANRYALTSVKQRDGKLSYFEVPKEYIKTTLVTMDGIGNQKAPGEQRGHKDDPFHMPLINNPANNPSLNNP